METLEMEMCVRGFHVYRIMWEAVVSEELECRRERGNQVDRSAVAVAKEDMVVGHIPQKISRLCSLFLRCGGAVTCHVTGMKRYSTDLPHDLFTS